MSWPWGHIQNDCKRLIRLIGDSQRIPNEAGDELHQWYVDRENYIWAYCIWNYHNGSVHTPSTSTSVNALILDRMGGASNNVLTQCVEELKTMIRNGIWWYQTRSTAQNNRQNEIIIPISLAMWNCAGTVIMESLYEDCSDWIAHGTFLPFFFIRLDIFS